MRKKIVPHLSRIMPSGLFLFRINFETMNPYTLVGLLGQQIDPSHGLYLHVATQQRKRWHTIKTYYLNGNAHACLQNTFISAFIFMVKFLEGI